MSGPQHIAFRPKSGRSSHIHPRMHGNLTRDDYKHYFDQIIEKLIFVFSTYIYA